MDSSDSDPESPTSKTRRYGLSDWMERLNTATDFEQYACSPPDTGFLSDYAAGMDSPCGLSAETVTDNATSNPIPIMKEEQKFQLDKLNIRPELESPVSPPKCRSPSSPKPLPILDALRCEEIIYSSPDTTPCVTPQASPIPRRKISGTLEETVQSNPRKWFFLGYTKEEDKLRLMKGQCKHPKIIKQSEGLKEKLNEAVGERIKSKPKVSGDSADFKLELSNFDMNAISPTSW